MISLDCVLVVEGKSDTQRLQQFYHVDTIETNGSEISKQTLNAIQRLVQIRPVVVFTDPDFSGEKIRQTVTQYVPEVGHAFLSRAQAKSNHPNDSLGVEHASYEALSAALAHIRNIPDNQYQGVCFSPAKWLQLGLSSGAMAQKRREILGDLLHIGYGNSKQFQKKLVMFGITEEEFFQAYEQMEALL